MRPEIKCQLSIGGASGRYRALRRLQKSITRASRAGVSMWRALLDFGEHMGERMTAETTPVIPRRFEEGYFS
jgi:hypothetical protein